MRSFDELGHFWFPGHEEDSLSGRLQVDLPSGRIHLELVGDFDRSFDRDDATTRLNGHVGPERVTLDRCILLNRSLTSGASGRKYLANQMFTGHHFGQKEDLAFKAATIEVGDLNSWVRRTGIKSEDKQHDWRGGAPVDPIYEMSFTPPALESHSFSRGEVALSFRWKRDGETGHRVDFRQWPVIWITYDDLQPYEVIRKDIGRIHNLVTLCVDAPTSVDRITFTRPDLKARALSGETIDADQAIEFTAPPLQYIDPKERKQRQPYQMLLSYDEIGGAATIARWIDTSQGFQRALDSMMSTRHTKQMFAENRFINVTFAAESFHRITQDQRYMDESEFSRLLNVYLDATPSEHHDWLRGKIGYGNEAPLRKRLQQLARRAGEATRVLVRKKDVWAYTLAQVRNELTHLGKDSRVFAGEDLYFLSESVYAVTRICMLLETGVSHETLAAKANADSMTWYSERLKRSLSTVRAQLADN